MKLGWIPQPGAGLSGTVTGDVVGLGSDALCPGLQV